MSEEESPRKCSRLESRISKITSTPNKCSNNGGGDGYTSRAPSVSTIYKSSLSSTTTQIDDDDASLELVNDCDNGKTRKTTSSVLSSSTTTTTTTTDEGDWKFDDYLKKFQWSGVWADLKPQDKNSLLYRITQSPNDIPIIVTELISDNQENIEIILIALFKLLANASGINDDEIDVEAIRGDDGIRVLVHKIEHRASKKHILMKDTQAGRHIYVIFSQFFINFIESAYNSKLLFHDNFEGYFFEFISRMTKSTLRSIRMPAVIAANSMLTGCLKLYKNRLNLNRKLRDKVKLDKTIDFFYYIFNTNCLVMDRDFFTVRLFTIQHLIQWIELFPQVFINKRKCLKLLCQLTKDTKSCVRLAAIHGFKQLMEIDDLNEYLNKFMERIFQIICSRCNDIDRKITNKSLNIIISMLPECNRYVNLDIKFQIVKIIFQDNASSAKLAGKFIVKYLRINHQTAEEFVVALVKILSIRKEFNNLMPLLVDACIDNCPEFTNFTLLSELILNAVNLKLRKDIVELMYETILYKLTGKFSFNRNVPFKQDDIEDNHQSIAKAILPRYEILLNVLKDQEDVFIRLTDILLIIDHEKCKIVELINVYVNIIKLYIDMLNEVTDRKHLEKVCEILSKFYTFDATVEEAMNIVIKDLIDTYRAEMQQLMEISNTTTYNNISELSRNISILYSCFNLRKFLKWQDIFDIIKDNQLIELNNNLITCCKWYLIWSLRCYRDNDDSINFILLKKQLQKFINKCLDILNVTPSRTKSLHIRVFADLSELYTQIGLILHEDKEKYEQFFIPINDEDQQKLVLQLIEHIITNKTLNLDCRRQHLKNFIGMLYQEILPITSYAYILKYYASHFNDYNQQIENIMLQLHPTPKNLSLVILDTLAVYYKDILEKQHIVDVNSDQAKPLTALAKKLCSFIKLKKFEGICLKLLAGAVNFTFMSRNHYEFLYFVRVFVDCLNDNQKVTLRKIFLQQLPQEDRRHDIMLVFSNCLKRNH